MPHKSVKRTSLGFIHPIDPLVLLPPQEGTACLDRHHEGERRYQAHRVQGSGLVGLIRHPRTPSNARVGVTEGIWKPAPGPGIYLVREDFFLEGGVEKTRWSVVATIDPEACPFHPIVTAPRDDVDCMIDHLREAGVDPVGACALYRDEDNHLERLVEARADELPLVTFRTALGGNYSVWCLPEDEGAAVAALIERSAGSLVGDVSLYRAILRLRDEPSFPSRPLPGVHFLNQRDFGLMLASTARIYPRSENFDINSFVAMLHHSYDVEEYPIREPQRFRKFIENVRMEGVTSRCVGVVINGLAVGLLVKVPEGDLPLFPATQPPNAAYEFDAEWVERGIVEPLLAPEQHEPLEVLADPQGVRAALTRDRAGIAFIVNPPPKRHLPDLAQAHWRLPYGALQIKPPVPRGLLLNPFRPVSIAPYITRG